METAAKIPLGGRAPFLELTFQMIRWGRNNLLLYDLKDALLEFRNGRNGG